MDYFNARHKPIDEFNERVRVYRYEKNRTITIRLRTFQTVPLERRAFENRKFYSAMEIIHRKCTSDAIYCARQSFSDVFEIPVETKRTAKAFLYSLKTIASDGIDYTAGAHRLPSTKKRTGHR